MAKAPTVDKASKKTKTSALKPSKKGLQTSAKLSAPEKAQAKAQEKNLANTSVKKPKNQSAKPKKPAVSDARSVQAEIIDAPAGTESIGRHARMVSPEGPARGSSRAKRIDPEILDGELTDETESPLVRGPSEEDLEEMEDGADLDSHLPDIVSSAGLAKKLSASKTLSISPDQESSTAVSASTDPVTTYLAEIRKYGLLTREQEHELAVRYREHGDSKAAELLITSNLRFVVKIAAEYSRFGAKLIDLIQEGNVGLMHAVREFNPYKGVKLITYAVWWIRGYIQEYLMRQYSMVRIGTTQNQRKLFYRLQKEKDLLESMGRDANYALISSRLGVTEDEVAMMTKRLTGRDVSLSQPIDGGDSTATMLDFEESHEPDAEVQIGDAEEMRVLKDNISEIRPSLSEKELYLLDERILSDDPLTLQEIGEHYGVTREAVRQLEVRLIGKIRAAVTESLDVGDHSDHSDHSSDEES